MPATFETLCRLDDRLVAKGHHPLTPWWREQWQRFYSHPSARTYIAQVGRGGAKSFNSTKVGLNETLFGDWQVGPGERHFWAYVSENKSEAQQRLRLLERFLVDLGVPYDRNGDEIALREQPRGFRVFACQIGAVSGFRCYGYSCDELAKWQSSAHLTNPAAEVVASLNATTVTHRGARRLLISSPFSIVDYHYEQHCIGDNPYQLTANAPSWVANPSISKEDTQAIESDQRLWLREYMAVPQASVSSAFDAEHVAAAFGKRWPDTGTQSIIAVDGSSGKRDSFAWVEMFWHYPRLGEPLDHCSVDTAGNDWVEMDLYETESKFKVRRDEKGRPIVKAGKQRHFRPQLCVGPFHAIDGEFFGTVGLDEIADDIAGLYYDCRARRVVSDQAQILGLQSYFKPFGVRYEPLNVNNSNKHQAVLRLRRLFADGMVTFREDDPKVRAEFLRYQEIIKSTGIVTYSGKQQKQSDDRVGAVVTGLVAELEGLMPDAPARAGALPHYEGAPSAPPRGYGTL